jgi:hypothetical protein
MATQERRPTAATLAADCAALISELQSAQARLQAMDISNGVFHEPDPEAQDVPQAPATHEAAADAPSSDFILELVTRFENIDARLDQTARRVRELRDDGFVVSGFPSGRTKISGP